MDGLISQLREWFLCHLVALGFLLFIAVAVIWRAELFGWSDEVSAEALSSPAERLPSEAAATVPRPTSPTAQAVGEALPTGRQHNASPTTSLAETLVDEKSPSPHRMPAEGSRSQGEDEQFRPLQEAGQSTAPASPQTALAQLPASSESLKATEAQPTSQAYSGVDTKQLLEGARHAFWTGALDDAESMYLGYLASRPGDAAAFAELGDLYRAMGRQVDAFDAYYEAGLRFKAQGNQVRLGQLVDLFRQVNDRRFLSLQN